MSGAHDSQHRIIGIMRLCVGTCKIAVQASKLKGHRDKWRASIAFLENRGTGTGVAKGGCCRYGNGD